MSSPQEPLTPPLLPDSPPTTPLAPDAPRKRRAPEAEGPDRMPDQIARRAAELERELKRLRREYGPALGRSPPQYKPGSSRVQAMMTWMQREYSRHAGLAVDVKRPTEASEASRFLAEFLDDSMRVLDTGALRRGYNWRDVPPRPNAKQIQYNVDS